MEAEDWKREIELQQLQPFKPRRLILEQELEEAELELDRPAFGLFLSGLTAGIGVSFSMWLIAVVHTAFSDLFPPPLLLLLIANAYAVGFVIVILGRTDLFTEFTTIAILPVLAKKRPFISIARLWTVVYLANLLGALLLAELAVLAGPAMNVIRLEAFVSIAWKIVNHHWWVILLSGIFAGWLMGFLSWLVVAGRETVSQVLFVWLITGTIGLTQLHHSIVGAAEVLAGMFAGEGIRFFHFSHFLLWATLGNALGGIAFAVIVHYSTPLSGVRKKDHRGKHGKTAQGSK